MVPFAAIAGAASGGMGMVQMFAPSVNAMRHQQYSWFPNLEMSAGQLISLLWYGIISREQYDEEMRIQGYDSDRAESLYQGGRSFLGLYDMVTAWRRGTISREGEVGRYLEGTNFRVDSLYAYAHKQGYHQEDVDRAIKLTEYVPNAQDIINFAVREVYHPEIAEAFGQFEGVDDVMEQAEDDIFKAGLPPDTFRKLWAAHWKLPGINNGFDMLHRGIIPKRDKGGNELSLEKLLTALDIMPGWREPLINLSYQPYTRVDVRRMHKTGVLDNLAVFRSYADLGYNPNAGDHEHETVDAAFACDDCRTQSKAGRMLAFTLLYNYEPPENEKTSDEKERATQRDLTKTDVLYGYREGLIAQTEASEALTALDYADDDIAYYIEREDYKRDKEETDTLVKYYHDMYVKGGEDFNTITTGLDQAGVNADRKSRLLDLWHIERDAKTARPTKADLLGFWRKGIIGDDILKRELAAWGYKDEYINWYMGEKANAG